MLFRPSYSTFIMCVYHSEREPNLSTYFPAYQRRNIRLNICTSYFLKDSLPGHANSCNTPTGTITKPGEKYRSSRGLLLNTWRKKCVHHTKPDKSWKTSKPYSHFSCLSHQVATSRQYIFSSDVSINSKHHLNFQRYSIFWEKLTYLTRPS